MSPRYFYFFLAHGSTFIVQLDQRLPQDVPKDYPLLIQVPLTIMVGYLRPVRVEGSDLIAELAAVPIKDAPKQVKIVRANALT